MLALRIADITTLSVDVIVNAANETLRGGGGVDGAIHRAAGAELLAYTQTLGGCPTGEARLSPGFALPARWIVHTVGPVWRGGKWGEAQLLENAYRNSLEVARTVDARTIAFPAISTGVYGYPKRAAAEIAVRAMREQEHAFERIVICCFSDSDASTYREVLGW